MRRAPWKKIATGLALLAALGFVFSVQYIPHLSTFEDPPPEDEPGLYRLGHAWWNYADGDRESFPWAIHVDEHFHMNVIAEMQRQDRLIEWDPYDAEPGEFSASSGLKGAVHERGYHIAMAQLQELTGVSTLHLYQFLPALWMVFTAFSIWALVRPHPAAVPAAAFVALIPTTVRFLGTGFLVPIGFSLAWLPITAILTRPAKKKAAAAGLLLMVVAWAFFIHLMAGFAALAVLLGAAVFSTGEGRRSAVTLFLLGLVPAAWLWRYFSGGIEQQVAREQFLPVDFTIFDNFGFLTLFVWGLGVALYWLDPPEDKRQRPAVAAFASLSLVALGLIVGTVVFDWGKYATYTRMHPIFFLTAAVPAGYAVAVFSQRIGQGISRGLEIGHRLVREQGSARASRAVSRVRPVLVVVLVLGVMGPVVSGAVGYHLDEGYYRVMTEEVWASYEEVEANHSGEGSPYEVFLSHPWRSPFLVETTGKEPHTVMRPGGPPANGEDWRGYLQGQRDAEFYIMNDITLVVGDREPPGGIWTRASDGSMVWVMQEAYAEQIQRIRDGKSLQLDGVPEEPIRGAGEPGSEGVAPEEDLSSYDR